MNKRISDPEYFKSVLAMLIILIFQISTFQVTSPSFQISVLEAEGHGAGIYIGGYTREPPSIDGLLAPSEWASAMNLTGAIGTIYVMNDDQNLYIALKTSDDSLSERIFSISFDNTHNGRLDIGDDILTYSGHFSDENINFIAPNTFAYGADGSIDGVGAATTDGFYNYYEFSHPLCSPDRSHDFCVSTGQVLGFTTYYVKHGFSIEWPASRSVDAYSWGDIVVADLGGIKPSTEIPTRYEICGDRKDNDSDGKVDEADLLPQPGVDWSNCILEYADLRHVNLEGANLQFASLTGANLSGAKLDHADISWASLNSADLSLASLESAILKGVDLTDSNLYAANLQSSDLTKASLHGSNLSDADLRGAILREATLSGANMNSTKIQGADLGFAYLSGMNLRGLDFTNVNLQDADLSETNLESANLSYRNLFEAGLNGANLRNAKLIGANLSRANLGGADLGNADLSNADLRFTYMDGANLQNAVLYGEYIPILPLVRNEVTDLLTFSIALSVVAITMSVITMISIFFFRKRKNVTLAY